MSGVLSIFLFPLVFAPTSVTGSAACPQKYVIANVLDQLGQPIADLSVSDFRASYRKRPLQVAAAAFRKDPGVRTVILLDISASMAGARGDPDKWKIARSAALEFLADAPPQAQVSLLTFADKVENRFESAGGRQAIEGWLNSKETREAKNVKGLTALYSTILDTAKAFEPVHPGDSIYVITDGGDTSSSWNASRFAFELESRGVRLFVFLLNDTKRAPLQDVPSERLYDLARASGGLAFNLKQQSAGSGWAGSGFHPNYKYDDALKFIRQSARWVQQGIGDFYVLTVVAPEGPSDPQEWKLTVVDSQGKERKDVILAYPEELAGCNAEAARH